MTSESWTSLSCVLWKALCSLGLSFLMGAMGDLKALLAFLPMWAFYAEREGLETEGWPVSTLQKNESTHLVTMSGTSLLPSQFVAVQS